jgi:hypothetical protein
MINQFLNKLPDELLNKIYSYVESNTNQIIKNSIKRYYNKKIFIDEDENTNWSLSRITKNNNKITNRKIFNLVKIKMFNSIKLLGYYREHFTLSRLIKDKVLWSCKSNTNDVLLKRNILNEYIQQPYTRRKKSGTKKVFIQSQKDYIKRKKM